VQQAEQVIEAVVCDVLRYNVAGTQPLFRRLEVPVTELVPAECIGRVDRVLEFEVLDPVGDRGAGVGKSRENPAILEVFAHLERSWLVGGL